MDVVQTVSAATQIVSCMIGAVGALEQASRGLEEASKTVKSLEELVCNLRELINGFEQKHVNKVASSQLDRQIQSLSELVQQMQTKIGKAKRMLSKNKVKKFSRVVWASMVGDPFLKLVQSIRNDLNWWLESQQLYRDVEKTIETGAMRVPTLLRINSEPGYPISSKCRYIKKLLELEDSHRVILIVGLSGIGKSCLARQVASQPPSKFMNGAVEVRFGQWCSRAACNGSKIEYQKRLAKKICTFLVNIGVGKKVWEETNGELENACFLLQEALAGKSILILLDDVWEQDIVERFAKLYDNGCRYLVTTRNEAIYEITEAEKVEICKDDLKEISREILIYHSLLNEEELPSSAEILLERCGHHPLTVAVMGKALRKEKSEDKWEKAIRNISTYATCAPGPVSYVNEKEAENTVTVFGSLEFSLEAMLASSRKLFIILAAVAWEEPVPEACLEALWVVLGNCNLFPLEVCKLVESSLLIKADSYLAYHVHDMVSLYLDGKVDDAVKILLIDSTMDDSASVSPWLFAFGKERVKPIAEQKMRCSLCSTDAKHVVTTLETIVQALMASKSVSDLEASSAGFSYILGPKVADLISVGSLEIVAAVAKSMMNIFCKNDYIEYHQSLVDADAIDKFANLMEETDEPIIQTSVSIVLAKMAEYGSEAIVDKVITKIPMNRLADLLVPQMEESDDNVFNAVISLIKAGNARAVDRMFASRIDKKLVDVIGSGSEIAQHHAIVTLKSFYESAGPVVRHYLMQGTFEHLPWDAKLNLERFALKELHVPSSPKPQSLTDMIHKMRGSDSRQVVEAMQDVVPIVEVANDKRVQDMILQSTLIEILAEFLHQGSLADNRIRCLSAFLILKLSCAGGEACVRQILDYNVIHDLVKMMQCNVAELQDAAYQTLHQMLFGDGGILVLNRMLESKQIERLVALLDCNSKKTREVSTHCLYDIVEIGNKLCIERMLAAQVVEKLVNLEKSGRGFGDPVVKFLKGLDKCRLSVAERRVLKQQISRKVKSAIKGHKLETQIIAAVEGYASEGSKSNSSGKHKR
ncbi:uncharacterized protein LOC116245680 [Nymphaea colorata]|nr:uncharacterized protein LOC116245680 [Nymphaea colorata]